MSKATFNTRQTRRPTSWLRILGQVSTSSGVCANVRVDRGISAASASAVEAGWAGSSIQARIVVGTSIRAMASGAGRSLSAAPRNSDGSRASATSGTVSGAPTVAGGRVAFGAVAAKPWRAEQAEAALAAGASAAEAATAELARADADDRRTHKIALVRRLAAATIEDAGSAR